MKHTLCPQSNRSQVNAYLQLIYFRELEVKKTAEIDSLFLNYIWIFASILTKKNICLQTELWNTKSSNIELMIWYIRGIIPQNNSSSNPILII